VREQAAWLHEEQTPAKGGDSRFRGAGVAKPERALERLGNGVTPFSRTFASNSIDDESLILFPDKIKNLEYAPVFDLIEHTLRATAVGTLRAGLNTVG
jgi:hypothetical protein